MNRHGLARYAPPNISSEDASLIAIRENHERTGLFRCQPGYKRHEEGFDRKSSCDRHARTQHRNLDINYPCTEDPHEALLDSPTPDRQRNRAAHLVEPPIAGTTSDMDPDSVDAISDEERKRQRVEEEVPRFWAENNRFLREQET